MEKFRKYSKIWINELCIAFEILNPAVMRLTFPIEIIVNELGMNFVILQKEISEKFTKDWVNWVPTNPIVSLDLKNSKMIFLWSKVHLKKALMDSLKKEI